MHFAVRCVVAAGLIGLSIAGCSSSKSDGDTADGGEMGTGGKGAGGKGSGGKGSAGSMCAAETGNDGCNKCLAESCCSDFTACVADPACVKAFSNHTECVSAPGAEPSSCFGDLTRELQGEGDAGSEAALPPIIICIIQSCSAACQGPGVV